MTYFLALMMPRYCRAEKHIPESISLYIEVFGLDVELNIFFTEKIKTGKSYLDVKRLSIEKKASIFQKNSVCRIGKLRDIWNLFYPYPLIAVLDRI